MARPFEKVAPSLTRLGPPQEVARREVLLIHGAWGGAWVWGRLAQDLAAAGYGVNLLEQPGHGEDRWDLPSFTSINDYADLSRRAAASLGRPVLVGHSLGGWQVQKIWEAEDLPGVLLAPLPGSGLPWRTFFKLNRHYPVQMSRPLLGLPVAVSDTAMARRVLFRDLDEAAVAEHVAHLAPEPAMVCLEMALLLGLGWGGPSPARLASRACSSPESMIICSLPLGRKSWPPSWGPAMWSWKICPTSFGWKTGRGGCWGCCWSF